MEVIINNKKYNKKYIDIYFKTIEYNKKCGSININKYKFDSLIKTLLKQFGKYTKASEIYYKYYDRCFVIVNGYNKNVYKLDSLKTEIIDNVIFDINDKIDVTIDEFPIIDKYHNIMKQNIIIYHVDNIDISLVTETYPAKSTNYYLKISFINNNIDIMSLNDIIKILKAHILD